jgi:hypothetical protein
MDTVTAMAEILVEAVEQNDVIHRSYPVVAGRPEPVALFGRLVREGIRLRRSGVLLHAEVPAAAWQAQWWPAVDRLLARHAASLALTEEIARGFRERHAPERVAELLVELHRDVPEILRETVGGGERLAALCASPSAGADLDLACIACCRGLAIRAIHTGRSVAGLLADGEGDGEERRRGDGAPEAPGQSQSACDWPTEQRRHINR